MSSNRAGYQLTPYGRNLLDKFRQWFSDVENAALDSARELFPFKVNSFDQSRGLDEDA